MFSFHRIILRWFENYLKRKRITKFYPAKEFAWCVNIVVNSEKWTVVICLEKWVSKFISPTKQANKNLFGMQRMIQTHCSISFANSQMFVNVREWCANVFTWMPCCKYFILFFSRFKNIHCLLSRIGNCILLCICVSCSWLLLMFSLQLAQNLCVVQIYCTVQNLCG